MLTVGISSPVPEEQPIRVLIFNCTSGRSGDEFLAAILQKTEERLTQFGSSETKEDFFAKVIFCSNVTYASGNFKGGKFPVHSARFNCHFTCVSDRSHLHGNVYD